MEEAHDYEPLSPFAGDNDLLEIMEEACDPTHDQGVFFDHDIISPTKPKDPWQESWEPGVDRGKVEIMNCQKTDDGDHYSVKAGCEGEVERVLGTIEQSMMITDENYSCVLYDSEPQEVPGVGVHGVRRFAMRCWQVVSVDRIQNSYIRNRFLDFGNAVMDNTNSEWVFHGTGEFAADSIREWGFSEKHVMRGAFGLGINTTPSMLTSLQFCKTFLVGKHIHYKVIVSEYYKGHSAIGVTNQRDFGQTDCGKPITNLTAPPGKGFVNVARFTDQLCPLYEVTLIVDTARKMTENEMRTIFISAVPYSNYYILEWLAAGNLDNETLLLKRSKYPAILEDLKNKKIVSNKPVVWSKSIQPPLPMAVTAATVLASQGGSLSGATVGSKRPQTTTSTAQTMAKVARPSQPTGGRYGFKIPVNSATWDDITEEGARKIKKDQKFTLQDKKLLCVEYNEFVDSEQVFVVCRIMQAPGNIIFFYLRPVQQDARHKIENEIWPARNQLFERFFELPKDCIVCKYDSMLKY